MNKWAIAAASRCGTSHIRRGERRQDAFTVFQVDDNRPWLVAVVSDGAGSAKMGGQGAALVCRIVSQEARSHLSAGLGAPEEDEIWNWVDTARDRIFLSADHRNLKPRDFAATMVMAISNGQDTIIAHIGDGAVVGKPTAAAHWTALSWPAGGEYAGTTFFATDDPQPQLRISRHSGPLSAISLFTDGLERLILDMHNNSPHDSFFDKMTAPLQTTATRDNEKHLSKKLGAYLESDIINDRTDDDKTLVLAVLTQQK